MNQPPHPHHHHHPRRRRRLGGCPHRYGSTICHSYSYYSCYYDDDDFFWLPVHCW